MILFWHKPMFANARWHAYSGYGHGRVMTLCGSLAIIGQGKPKTARARMPRNGRCGACLKKLRDDIHHEGEKP